MNQNPLVVYLEANGIKRIDFAKTLGTTRARVTQICQDGVSSISLAAKIELATGGAVRIEHWQAWIKENEKTTETV